MPFQKKLIQANEAGAWTSNNRQINFTIPSNIDIVDLTQSALVLDIVITNRATGADLGLYDAQFRNQYDARCLINSIKVTTNKGGLVEEYQNSNVLTQNLLNYNKSTELTKSQSWLGQGQTYSDYGPFLTKYNKGSTESLQQCAIPIPFKSILGVGNQSQWLNGNFEGTNVEVNLEYYSSTVAGMFEQVLLTGILATSNVVDTATSAIVVQTAVANNHSAIPWYVGEPVAMTFTPTWTPIVITATVQSNPAEVFLTVSPESMFIADGDTITIAGFTGNWIPANGDHIVANVDNVARSLTLTGIDSTGFGVGTGAPTGVRLVAEQVAQVSNGTISSIAISAGNVITVTSSWNQHYGGAVTALSARASAIANVDLSYKINNAQLALVQQVPSPSQQSALSSMLSKSIDIPFFTWNVERVNMPTVGANMKYNKLIDLLPNCRQVFIMVPSPASVDPLSSDQDDQSNYQFSLDTVYTTSRAIVPLDALYHNSLIGGFANCKQALNSLNGNVIWSQLVPVDGMSHQLQYEFTQGTNAGTANKIMYVFQCIDKVMNTKSAMVMNA
jgi:hypothetical protein